MILFSFESKVLRVGFLLSVILFSCRKTSEVPFPYLEAGQITPQELIMEPLRVSLNDTLLKVVHIKDLPTPSSNPVVEKELIKVKAHPNVHVIPDDLKRATIDHKNLIKVPFQIDSNRESSNYLIRGNGDTIFTGISVPAKGNGAVMNFSAPKPSEALLPRYKINFSENISYLDVNEGLNSSYVYSILKDAKGSLWFGHRLGLSKYDGVSFVDYSDKLGFNLVWDATKDRQDNLWFGTNAGVISYNGETFRKLTEADGLIYNDVWSLLEDRQGYIWIATYQGVSRYDGKNFVHITKNEGLIDDEVNALLEDTNGNIWFGTQKGVSFYDGEAITSFTKQSGLNHNEVISLCNDSKGQVWIGTNGGGVNVYDGTSFTYLTDGEGLSANFVRSIIQDSLGHMWVVTDGGGFNKYDGATFTHYTDKEGLLANDLYAAIDDKEGNLWLGDNGGGVDRYRKESFQHYTETEGLSNSFIYTIVEDQDDHLWLGGDESGLTMYDGESFVHYDVKKGANSVSFQSGHLDLQGNIWFGSWQHGAFKYDGEKFVNYTEREGLSDDVVSAIEVDKKGNVWFGTNAGLIKYDGSTFMYYADAECLHDNTVNSILEDQKGNLWIGTNSGLSCFDGVSFANYNSEKGFPLAFISFMMEDHEGNVWFGSRDAGLSIFDGERFFTISERDGLSHNAIGSITQDKNHNIWIGTEKGLDLLIPAESHADRFQFKILSYEAGDGLKGLDFLVNSTHLDKKNKLWLGSGKGLTVIDLNTNELSEDPPLMHLRRLDINENYIDFRNPKIKEELKIDFSGVTHFENFPVNLSLPFSQNHLTFHYSAIDWEAQHALTYSYVLDGLKEPWSQITKEAKADYRNIPAGEYTFRVRAQGRNQVWSEEATFSFVVRPPWYQTTWAYATYLVFLLFSGYTYTRWRTRSLEAQKKVLEKTVSERTADLQASNQQLADQKEEIQLQAFELEKMNELKSKFYSVVGHDLRSPLTKLFAVVFKIKRAVGNTNTEMQRALKEFDGLYRQFVELLDNVLDWGLMDSDSKRVTLRSESLNDLVDNVVQLYQTFALDKQINLLFDEDGGEDISVNIDKGSIEIVLRNLISNAIKFTHEEGTIQVRLFQDENRAGFSVIDSGVGIPEDKLIDIFEIKEKKGTVGTKGEKGSGLGLKLAHDFVKMNKGEIAVESQVGQGTTITVILPLVNGLGAKPLQ